MLRSVVTVLGVLTSFLVIAQAPRDPAPKPLVPGNPAPPLAIRKWVNGSPVDPSRGDGKTTYVVEFWATWCPPCRKSIPHLRGIQKKYKDRNVVVIGISRETVAEVEPFARSMRMDYHVAVDEGGRTYRSYMAGVRGIPHAFLVDKRGRVAWAGHPMAGLDSALDGLLAGQFDPMTAGKVSAKEKELQRAMRSGSLDKVLGLVNELIKLKPKNYAYYRLKKRILSARRDHAAVAATLDKAIRNCSDDPVALGQIALDLGAAPNVADRDPERSLALAQKAAAMSEGKSAPALSTLARVYFEVGLVDQAIRAQKTAVSLAEGRLQKHYQAFLDYFRKVKVLRDKVAKEQPEGLPESEADPVEKPDPKAAEEVPGTLEKEKPEVRDGSGVLEF